MSWPVDGSGLLRCVRGVSEPCALCQLLAQALFQCSKRVHFGNKAPLQLLPSLRFGALVAQVQQYTFNCFFRLTLRLFVHGSRTATHSQPYIIYRPKVCHWGYSAIRHCPTNVFHQANVFHNIIGTLAGKLQKNQKLSTLRSSTEILELEEPSVGTLRWNLHPFFTVEPL